MLGGNPLTHDECATLTTRAQAASSLLRLQLTQAASSGQQSSSSVPPPTHHPHPQQPPPQQLVPPQPTAPAVLAGTNEANAAAVDVGSGAVGAEPDVDPEEAAGDAFEGDGEASPSADAAQLDLEEQGDAADPASVAVEPAAAGGSGGE
eukprot:4362003-Prymnesium_polylepis.2